MSARKVLYISPNAHLGGAEKVCEIFLKYHDRKKYLPSIAFLRGGPLVDQFRELGVETHLLPHVRVRDVFQHSKLIEKVAQIITENKIEIVHSTMTYGHFFGGRAANSAGVKNVWFQHGPVGGTFDKLVSLIRTDGILVNSEFTKNEQLRIMKKDYPLHVVYAAVEESRLSEADRATKRERLRTRYHIQDDEIVVGMVGRLQEWKGQFEFLKAFHAAHAENSRLRAIVVGSSDIGNPDFENELKKYIETAGLRDRAILTGFVDIREEVYQSFDLLVHASTAAEPFGLTPLEAMIRGIPVIASPLGGPSETIEDGKTGLLVLSTDTKALAQAILKLAGDQKLREKLGSAGREGAQKFLAPKLLERVEAIYDRL